MARLFHFRGEASLIDVTARVNSDPRLVRFRRTLEKRYPPERAQAMVEDMLVAGMRHFGDQYVAVNADRLDRVLALRAALEDQYHIVLKSGRGKGRTIGVTAAQRKANLMDIERLYAELDETFDALGRPTEGLDLATSKGDLARRFKASIERHLPGQRPHRTRSVRRDMRVEAGQKVSRFKRHGFKRVEPGVYALTFKDGTSVRYEVVEGRYRLQTFDPNGQLVLEFGEYDTLVSPYRNRPKTSSIMNAHHGLQNDLMKLAFEDYGYDGGAVPTMWLRDGRAGSPHGMITAMQNSTHAARTKLKTPTYSQIRDWGIQDMRTAGVPTAAIHEYLAHMDAYFRRAVVPNLERSGELRRLGTWEP